MSEKKQNLMQLSLAELKQAAEHFGVEGSTKREIVDELQVKELKIKDYYDAFPVDTGDAKSSKEVFEAASEKVLVRMTRANAAYEINGFKFTKTHPFQLMRRSEADEIIKVEEGFRLASAEEAKEYYS